MSYRRTAAVSIVLMLALSAGAQQWRERVVRSVAKLTRADGEEFLRLAPEIPIRTEVTACSPDEVNTALVDLRKGRLEGSGVILIEGE